MDIHAETPLFIDPQQDDPGRYIEYIVDKPRAIQGNAKGRITIEKTGIDRQFLDERRFRKYQWCKRLYESMTALREFLHHSALMQEERQYCNTLTANIQEQLDNAQKDEAEFALMIRCAIQHEFRY